MMKGKWIYCEDGSRLYIGSCWQGTEEEMKRTQAAIDERCALYEEASTSEEAAAHDDDIEWLEELE